MPIPATGGKTALEKAEERIKAYGMFSGANSELSHNLNRQFESIEQKAIELLRNRKRTISITDKEFDTKAKSKQSKQFILSTHNKLGKHSERLGASKSESKMMPTKNLTKALTLEEQAIPIENSLKMTVGDSRKQNDRHLNMKRSFERSLAANWNADSSLNMPLQKKHFKPANDSVLLGDDTLPLESSRGGQHQPITDNIHNIQTSLVKRPVQDRKSSVTRLFMNNHGSLLHATNPQSLKPMIAKTTRRARQPTEFEKAFLLR